MKTTAVPLYTDALQLYTHDTGYAVSTEHIPWVGIGGTPAQARTDLLTRWHRTKLLPLLGYAHAAENMPPPAIDYFGGIRALTMRLTLVARGLSVRGVVWDADHRYRSHARDPTSSGP